MPRKARAIHCDALQRERVMALARSRTNEARLVERAQMIQSLLDGASVNEAAAKAHTRPNTVIVWRDRFCQAGVEGLYDRPRSGKPVRYGVEFRNRLLARLEKKPPDGLAQWDGPTLAKRLGSSVHAVWRVLRKEGICLQRQRSWCVSTDPEFAPKAADVVGLYLDPPCNALVLSVDEKPSMQALERKTGYVLTDSGKIARGLQSTYKRHGTLNLFAALEVATGAIHAQTTTLKRRIEFLQFMDGLMADIPADKDVHVILDNYCIHKRNDAWLKRHPNVRFHFTPTSASWLNQVEIWFGIMSRKVLRGASFNSTEQLRDAIEKFIKAYSTNAKPFKWRKRDVKGAQLRNTIVNLCN